MAKSGHKPAKADTGGQRPSAPPPSQTREEGVVPASKTLPPSSGKSGAKKG